MNLISGSSQSSRRKVLLEVLKRIVKHSLPWTGCQTPRPLGQSFRESVGPANVKLSGGTPHSTASQSRNGFEEKRVCGENEWTTAWSYKNRKTMAASSFKGHTIAEAARLCNCKGQA